LLFSRHFFKMRFVLFVRQLLTPKQIIDLKGQRKITMLTAYDYPTAKILSSAGIDILLVGDSLGMVVLGFKDTKSVTLEDMIRHSGAVVRGNQGSLVVADMPIHTTDAPGEALRHALRLLRESGAQAVKLEGQPEIIEFLTRENIAVMGHTGLKPQSAQKYGLTGKNQIEADKIFEEALALEKAGVFAIVLECVPGPLAAKITQAVKVPTIGIGAGEHCDGQVLVSSDMLGLFDDFKPKFVRRYGQAAQLITGAAQNFKKDVENGNFPLPEESYL
jgi:3-methyl-2-oxobutanoate hydroxymethyltransferase